MEAKDKQGDQSKPGDKQKDKQRAGEKEDRVECGDKRAKDYTLSRS